MQEQIEKRQAIKEKVREVIREKVDHFESLIVKSITKMLDED